LLTVTLFLICNVTLTSAQEKVVVLDSTQASIIIKDLVRGDVCCAEVKVLDSLLRVANQRIKTMKEANDTLKKAFDTKQMELDAVNNIVVHKDSVIRKEKRKKSFWKYLAMALGVLYVVK